MSLFLVSSRSSNTPLYPFKVLRVKKRAPTFCSFVVFSLDSHLNPLRSLGVRHHPCLNAHLLNHFYVLYLIHKIFILYCWADRATTKYINIAMFNTYSMRNLEIKILQHIYPSSLLPIYAFNTIANHFNGL